MEIFKFGGFSVDGVELITTCKMEYQMTHFGLDPEGYFSLRYR